MLKTVYLLTCFCALSQQRTFENKVITTLRHGIEKNLNYIEMNYRKVNVDCLFGVVLTTAIVKDAYQNGSHVMDSSSLKLINKSVEVLKKGIPLIKGSKVWMSKYILDYTIWEKKIKYKYNNLGLFSRTPNPQVLQNIYRYQNSSNGPPTTDFCLQDIVNETIALIPNKCHLNEKCWNKYYVYNKLVSGYTLTHELLLLQLAKTRKCIINHKEYEEKTKRLCELIYSEVFNGDYFGMLDDIFDLFLEEIILCGYEGYAEFLKHKWLYYILKSQRSNGCFPAFLRDNLKTRIRRNTNILEDGCADHTTGLGAAVLSLHYNFIIKENINNLK